MRPSPRDSLCGTRKWGAVRSASRPSGSSRSAATTSCGMQSKFAEFTRKHTANVHEGLREIRRLIETFVAKRDERRDGFVQVLSKAMGQSLGHDAESVTNELTRNGISRNLARKATEIARQQGAFTIFALVDALTRLTQATKYVGDRTQADAKVASLLALAA